MNAARSGELVEETDWHDPRIALGEWERMLREDLGHDGMKLVSDTLSETAQYLSWVLTDLARDEKQAIVLAELAEAVRKSRAHLEAVLHDSRAPERGVECPRCDHPAPRLAKRYATHDLTGANDTWRCPRDPDHWWFEAEYRKWVADDYLGNADWLSASDMQRAHGIKPGTTRQWAARGQVKRKQTSAGRWVYNVEETLAAAGDTDTSEGA